MIFTSTSMTLCCNIICFWITASELPTELRHSPGGGGAGAAPGLRRGVRSLEAGPGDVAQRARAVERVEAGLGLGLGAAQVRNTLEGVLLPRLDQSQLSTAPCPPITAHLAWPGSPVPPAAPVDLVHAVHCQE